MSFQKHGDIFIPCSITSLNLYDTLPPDIYVVKVEKGQYYLEPMVRFSLPKRTYGNVTKDAGKILNTFRKRGATGALFLGEKGSGKTLLAKTICDTALKADIPTLLINTPHAGDEFNTFLSKIEQPCILLFDEFEKVYVHDSDNNRYEQRGLLTVLDGVFTSNKLFLLTCNNKWAIDDHMWNRPGRIFYLLEFRGIDQEFIIEYCNENLNDKSQIDSICTLAMLFRSFNFDMLQSLVEEMNRYKETAKESLRMLNIKPESESYGDFTVRMYHKGKEIKCNKDYSGQVLSGDFRLMYYINKAGNPVLNGKKESAIQVSLFLSSEDLKTVDRSNGEYIFEKGDFSASLFRTYKTKFNYDKVL